ncbi:AAA family ATPase [Rhodococcus sp. NPDC049939]|uniref:AAA family ATPase n=1 Tax=Rhodococcus sp. NPDC049939 TaxID=3155511 RepID=UPI00340D3A78
MKRKRLITEFCGGLLRKFHEAEVLEVADVHVARRLGKLGGETREEVHLATAFAVRAVRNGSVCMNLAEIHDVTARMKIELDPDERKRLDAVAEALRSSPLVVGGDEGPLCPLRLEDAVDDDGLPELYLYLDRYDRQEQTVKRILGVRAKGYPAVKEGLLRDGLDELFHDPAPARQRIAAAVAATHWTSVIAGGPGTGKTSTVAKVLALLARQDPGLRIGLAAPTGKAAARLQESVRSKAFDVGLWGRKEADKVGRGPELSAMTLHRMLGWQRGASRFRYNENNHLPYDVIVVDETSMVSLTMMCRLLGAVRPEARLVLVGDPDQLASVDAGAVLKDLVDRTATGVENPVLARVVGADLSASDGEEALSETDRDRLRGAVIELTKNHRFGEGQDEDEDEDEDEYEDEDEDEYEDEDGESIAELVGAVRERDADRVLKILRSGVKGVSFIEIKDDASTIDIKDLTELCQDVVSTAQRVAAKARVGNAVKALKASQNHRLLCAHRDGPFGVSWWAREAVGWIAEEHPHIPLDPGSWYEGQPLLVTENDHDLRVYNGDTGVVVADGRNGLIAAIDRGKKQKPLRVHPSRLASVQTAYAMTIHRSQGSEYRRVSVILPEAGSLILTRELLYTAISRARKHVRIVGTEEAVREGVERQVPRASGLQRG